MVYVVDAVVYKLESLKRNGKCAYHHLQQLFKRCLRELRASEKLRRIMEMREVGPRDFAAATAVELNLVFWNNSAC